MVEEGTYLSLDMLLQPPQNQKPSEGFSVQVEKSFTHIHGAMFATSRLCFQTLLGEKIDVGSILRFRGFDGCFVIKIWVAKNRK